MPSVLSEARRMCPELTDAMKTFDKLAYSRSYGEVFYDCVDGMVWEHLFPHKEGNPLDKYQEKEKQAFKEIFLNVKAEVKKRVGLWTGVYGSGGWYDPLGKMYECITSKNKSSQMGQYFTPEPVVEMITQLTNVGGSDKAIETVLDPACGSGRMGLAAASRAFANKKGCWVSMNDIDPICTKMTAVNMALNGVVGEALCMDGLDVTGETYRFGYRVEPSINFIPPEMVDRMYLTVLFQTGENIKKQYVLRPISYEQTVLKKNNDALLAEYKERQEIEDEAAKEKALQELQEQVKARMAGTLFENDTSQIENIDFQKKKKPPSPTSTPKKNKLPPQSGGMQGSLF